MYNAGVALKFGPGKTVNKVALQKQGKYLQDKNKAQDETIAGQNAKISAQDAKIEQQGKENAELKETLKNVLDRLQKLEKGKR